MQLGLSALKPAEDGSGLILRVYEPAGGRGSVSVTPGRIVVVSARPSTCSKSRPRAADMRILPFKVPQLEDRARTTD